MDFIDQLKHLTAKILRQRDVIQTEEATKNAFIMPFIASLGYDVFDPTEVVPEYVADMGIKKGEKVDYAIMRDGQPIMFFECKKAGADLGNAHASQLYRYFSTHPSLRIGILTNGIQYHFYSDLENANIMDAKPFLEFNMLDIQEPLVGELKKLGKGIFNVEEIISAASELKYAKEIRKILQQQLDDPTEEFVKYILSAAYSGTRTQKLVNQFKDITKRAFNQFVNDKINERLKSAMATNTASGSVTPEVVSPAEPPVPTESKPTVETTPEEMEGYLIVKTILRDTVSPERVVIRDAQNYCNVLLDDSNRKIICRMYLNSEKKKYLALFDEQKNEQRIPIETLNDIFKYEEQLRTSVLRFIAERPHQAEESTPTDSDTPNQDDVR